MNSKQLSLTAQKIIRKYKRHNKRDRPDAFYSWHETEILLQQYRQKQASKIKPIAAKYRLITNGQQLKELLEPLIGLVKKIGIDTETTGLSTNC